MIKLGKLAQDKLTGFKGIVMAEAHYLTGCTTYGLLPLKLKQEDGTPADWVWLDAGRLIEVKGKKKGGPANPSAPMEN